MTKRLIAAATLAAATWAGAAFADDGMKDEFETQEQQSQQVDEFDTTEDEGFGGSGTMEEQRIEEHKTTVRQPETNVDVDVNAPAAATQPVIAEKPEKKEADMRGLTLTLGGGVEGYTGSLAPRLEAGPAWGLNAELRPSKVFGVELGYNGAANEVDVGEAIEGGMDVIRNGGHAVATVGLSAAPVQPYILGGVGVSRYEVRGGAAGLRDDTVGNVPIGAGLRSHFGDFTADLRGTYSVLFDNQLGTPTSDTSILNFETGGSGRYLGSLNIGTTF